MIFPFLQRISRLTSAVLRLVVALFLAGHKTGKGGRFLHFVALHSSPPLLVFFTNKMIFFLQRISRLVRTTFGLVVPSFLAGHKTGKGGRFLHFVALHSSPPLLVFFTQKNDLSFLQRICRLVRTFFGLVVAQVFAGHKTGKGGRIIKGCSIEQPFLNLINETVTFIAGFSGRCWHDGCTIYSRYN